MNQINLEKFNKELPMIEGKLDIETLEKTLKEIVAEIQQLEINKMKLIQYGAEIQGLIRYAKAGKIGFK